MSISTSLTGKPWETPELTHINRLPARATLIPYPSEKAALADQPARSSWFCSLNGEWRFRLFKKPESVPARCLARSADPQEILWQPPEKTP